MYMAANKQEWPAMRLMLGTACSNLVAAHVAFRALRARSGSALEPEQRPSRRSLPISLSYFLKIIYVCILRAVGTVQLIVDRPTEPFVKRKDTHVQAKEGCS